jgi:hypothetical protein
LEDVALTGLALLSRTTNMLIADPLCGSFGGRLGADFDLAIVREEYHARPSLALQWGCGPSPSLTAMGPYDIGRVRCEVAHLQDRVVSLQCQLADLRSNRKGALTQLVDVRDQLQQLQFLAGGRNPILGQVQNTLDKVLWSCGPGLAAIDPPATAFAAEYCVTDLFC